MSDKGDSKRGRGRPPKHGAYSGHELIPLTEEKTALVQQVLSGRELIVRPVDKVAVELLGRNLAKLELIDRWLQVNGIFAADGFSPQPILRIYFQAMAAATRLCNDLGMTPTARASLSKTLAQVADFATQMQEAEKDNESEE